MNATLLGTYFSSTPRDQVYCFLPHFRFVLENPACLPWNSIRPRFDKKLTICVYYGEMREEVETFPSPPVYSFMYIEHINDRTRTSFGVLLRGTLYRLRHQRTVFSLDL